MKSLANQDWADHPRRRVPAGKLRAFEVSLSTEKWIGHASRQRCVALNALDAAAARRIKSDAWPAGKSRWNELFTRGSSAPTKDD